jgi:hypothetical protein
MRICVTFNADFEKRIRPVKPVRATLAQLVGGWTCRLEGRTKVFMLRYNASASL